MTAWIAWVGAGLGLLAWMAGLASRIHADSEPGGSGWGGHPLWAAGGLLFAAALALSGTLRWIFVLPIVIGFHFAGLLLSLALARRR